MDKLPDDLIGDIFSNFLVLKDIGMLYISNFYKKYNIKFILEKQQLESISKSIYKKCEKFSFHYKLKENFEGRKVVTKGNSLMIFESYGKHPISNFFNTNSEEINKLIFNCKRFIDLKEQNRVKQIRLKYLNLLGIISANIILQMLFFRLSKYFKNSFIKYLFEFFTSILFLGFLIHTNSNPDIFYTKWEKYFYKYFEAYSKYKIFIEIFHYIITNLILMYFLFHSDFVNE